MTKKILFQSLMYVSLCVVITSCGNKKFDRQQWSYGNGLDYPLRNDVINDLVKNHKLKGLTYRQVIDSLGDAQKRDTLSLSYQIQDNSFAYNRKKPTHKKSLILYFSKDSVVTRFEVYEHTNKK